MKKSATTLVVYLGIAAALAIFLITGAMTYWVTQELIDVDHALIETYTTLHAFENVKDKLKNAVIAQRNFLITGDETDLAAYAAEQQTIQQALKTLRQSLDAENQYQDALDALEELLEQNSAIIQEMIRIHTLHGSGLSAQHPLIDQSQTVMAEIREHIETVEQGHILRIKHLRDHSETNAQTAIIVMGIGDLVACTLLVASFSLLTRQINRRKRMEHHLSIRPCFRNLPPSMPMWRTPSTACLKTMQTSRPVNCCIP